MQWKFGKKIITKRIILALGATSCGISLFLRGGTPKRQDICPCAGFFFSAAPADPGAVRVGFVGDPNVEGILRDAVLAETGDITQVGHGDWAIPDQQTIFGMNIHFTSDFDESVQSFDPYPWHGYNFI